MLKYYIEFKKDAKDEHPDTGKVKNGVVKGVYFYSDKVEFWGWGTFSEYVYGGRSIKETIEKVKEKFTKSGFYLKIARILPSSISGR